LVTILRTTGALVVVAALVGAAGCSGGTASRTETINVAVPWSSATPRDDGHVLEIHSTGGCYQNPRAVIDESADRIVVWLVETQPKEKHGCLGTPVDSRVVTKATLRHPIGGRTVMHGIGLPKNA
jgi:hypothetical protein